MSDRRKEAEKKMAKAIFISADCWLCVFDLLPALKLGLGIALISHRFDFYVDEHFKTRKRALKCIRIGSNKIGKNGTKEMEIANYQGQSLSSIPKIPLTGKVTGFKIILINYIDKNAIDFLHCFRSLFASSYPINLFIYTISDRILALIFRNIWPMIAKNIQGMFLFADVFRGLRKIAPSFLNDFSLLRIYSSYSEEFFTEFPADDNAAASDEQAVAKWLFTAHPSKMPKLFNCSFLKDNGDWATKISAFKAEFASASSPANFIVVIWFRLVSFADSVVPFVLTNELTREQLSLKRTKNRNRFLLIRCPIVRDASKWAKWEKEAISCHFTDQWNQIVIPIAYECDIGDGLLDTMIGPVINKRK
ncbi:hypothetical protein niasHT_031808 [Heterodera trifolii]|uniref:Uncharacterized protein n=1 Tax=Heterodera trifolii TaxID=157864 RepID=A0ABD2IHB2_9BILA